MFTCTRTWDLSLCPCWDSLNSSLLCLNIFYVCIWWRAIICLTNKKKIQRSHGGLMPIGVDIDPFYHMGRTLREHCCTFKHSHWPRPLPLLSPAEVQSSLRYTKANLAGLQRQNRETRAKTPVRSWLHYARARVPGTSSTIVLHQLNSEKSNTSTCKFLNYKHTVNYTSDHRDPWAPSRGGRLTRLQ